MLQIACAGPLDQACVHTGGRGGEHPPDGDADRLLGIFDALPPERRARCLWTAQSADVVPVTAVPVLRCTWSSTRRLLPTRPRCATTARALHAGPDTAGRTARTRRYRTALSSLLPLVSACAATARHAHERQTARAISR